MLRKLPRLIKAYKSLSSVEKPSAFLMLVFYFVFYFVELPRLKFSQPSPMSRLARALSGQNPNETLQINNATAVNPK